ncbi:uncharacterized protein FA14DRAFT_142799 [Meira miltonrushii]|uniref:Uncharacterized protein n=1 Tax=Meira miltonrushii TaxID=1280837 RepID=A0A316VKB6_9BASI|nr:uncharacterized protein FA14DRAFT_142799 [Meira miltonrushii]PWN38032.1 hypothetical protein FA14DRAFT_142799 [Meira miltonrushii]
MASESIFAPQAEQPGSSTGPLDQIDDVPANPYLTTPSLYIHDLDANISDKELASAIFAACLPVRLHIDRNVEGEGQRLKGSVEFQTLEKAERAFATVQSPQLSINEDPSQDQKPSAKPRLIKQLPHGTEDSDVFDLFRPFGPLHSATRIVTNPAGHHTGFRGMAVVVYYDEEDAQRAQTEMHCAEVDGKSISVTIDNVAKRPSAPQGTNFSASAAPFVPGGGSFSSMSAAAPSFQPPRGSPLGSPLGSSTFNVPGTNLQYSGSTGSTVVDPCNLFCKNLDPAIDSNELFSLFKTFGKIVSARVMRDEKGVSREFGFVSYRRAEDATRALNAMNGTQHGSKSMIVRLHEPKSFRQEKLSHKFGTSYVPDSPNDVGSGGAPSDINDSPSGIGADGAEVKQRPMSNSYFRAAASGEGDGLDLEQLRSVNATLRGDILRGGFSRKVKEIDDISPDQADALIAELSKLKLVDAVGALNDRQQLQQRIAEIRSSQGAAPGGLTIPTTSDSASITSSHLPAGASERERLLEKVKDLMPAGSPVEDITDLLTGLPKKERAMALFNQDYLRNKVEEAKSILELGDDDDGEPTTSPIVKTGDAANGNGSATSTKTYTLSDLAKMPAADIVRLAGNPQSSGLPLPKADPAIMKETDTFIDGLKNLSEQDQKQKLGDQLFKKIRTFGFKGAPKITIHLLDSEDLRSLAHLMNSYPECLREKVALQASK